MDIIALEKVWDHCQNFIYIGRIVGVAALKTRYTSTNFMQIYIQDW